MLASLGKATYFTILDLKSYYWQIPLNKDKEKTAFTCHRGLYKYNVNTFSLANTPGILHELMSIVLHGLGDFVLAYLDDIILLSASEEEHKQHIQKMFDCLRQHNIKSTLSKCKFMQKETQYLAFIITEDGIMADPDKVKVMKQMILPTCVREVRSFTGMCSYYKRFIQISQQLQNLSLD